MFMTTNDYTQSYIIIKAIIAAINNVTSVDTLFGIVDFEVFKLMRY